MNRLQTFSEQVNRNTNEAISQEGKKRYKDLIKEITKRTEIFFGTMVSINDNGYKYKVTRSGIHISYKGKFATELSIIQEFTFDEDIAEWHLNPIGGVGTRTNVKIDPVCKMYIIQGDICRNWDKVVKFLDQTHSELQDLHKQIVGDTYNL